MSSLPPDDPNHVAKPVEAISSPALEPELPAPARRDPAPEPDEDVDVGLEALWAKVLSEWADAKPHNAALEYAAAREQLPELAGRYRALKDDPDKGAFARKRLEAIVTLATSMLMATASARPARRVPPVVTALAVAVSFGLMFWLARALLGR